MPHGREMPSSDPGYAITVAPVPPTIFVRVNGLDPCPPGPGRVGLQRDVASRRTRATRSRFGPISTACTTGVRPRGRTGTSGPEPPRRAARAPAARDPPSRTPSAGMPRSRSRATRRPRPCLALVSVANVTASNRRPGLRRDAADAHEHGACVGGVRVDGPQRLLGGGAEPDDRDADDGGVRRLHGDAHVLRHIDRPDDRDGQGQPNVPTAGNNGPSARGRRSR